MTRYVVAAVVLTCSQLAFAAGPKSDTYTDAKAAGLDYALQEASLDAVPDSLEAGVRARLEHGGFADDILGVLLELKSAGASSLDFLVYVTVASRRAADYHTLERTIQQGCLAVANQQGWSIPFPQMTIHRAAVGGSDSGTMPRAA